MPEIYHGAPLLQEENRTLFYACASVCCSSASKARVLAARWRWLR